MTFDLKDNKTVGIEIPRNKENKFYYDKIEICSKTILGYFYCIKIMSFNIIYICYRILQFVLQPLCIITCIWLILLYLHFRSSGNEVLKRARFSPFYNPWSVNPYHAEFLKWNNPPSIFDTIHYHLKGYQDENLKLVSQQYRARMCSLAWLYTGGKD